MPMQLMRACPYDAKSKPAHLAPPKRRGGKRDFRATHGVGKATAPKAPPLKSPRAKDCQVPIAESVTLAEGVRIAHPELVNLYGCAIGAETRIAAFVEIQKNAFIGARCKISSHSFICEGVTIEDECFVGHNVCFTNDRFPRATAAGGALQTEADWHVVPTRVCRGASIGSGAVILCGVTIGPGALIGAGAVVTHDVAAEEVVAGVPARSMSSNPRRVA
jgi:acetyltransferase-like isoleucine patch superfamily enzyme